MANRITRRVAFFARSERGDGAIGSIISMSVFIVLLVVFVWMILTYYSFRVLSTAANEGAAEAARYAGPGIEPDAERGAQYARDLIENTGSSSLVENVVVEVGSSGGSEAGSPDDKRVEIVVTGKSVTPFFSLDLRATGSAPIEEFRPQGEEV